MPNFEHWTIDRSVKTGAIIGVRVGHRGPMDVAGVESIHVVPAADPGAVDPEHWLCPNCGEVDGARAGNVCHGPSFTGQCASAGHEVVEISAGAAKRLAGAV